jgi:hypothetical protein
MPPFPLRSIHLSKALGQLPLAFMNANVSFDLLAGPASDASAPPVAALNPAGDQRFLDDVRRGSDVPIAFASV